MTHVDPPRPQLGLMGTIPIYWGEADGMGDLIRGEAHTHWARDLIEEHAEPIPLDYLTPEALAPLNMLLMAQPRGLTGEENVALDAWVRGGGRLLLFADPVMTGPSRFHIGDRRRPQDTILLSPILTHWGLRLTLHDGDAATHHDHSAENLELAELNGQQLPFNEPGEFALVEDTDDCTLLSAGLLARCAIGEGEVLVMADAAIIDIAGPYPKAEAGFGMLLQTIFPEFGDGAGNHGENAEGLADSPEFSSNSNCHADDANHECA